MVKVDISVVKPPSLMSHLELSFVFSRCLGLGLRWGEFVQLEIS